MLVVAVAVSGWRLCYSRPSCRRHPRHHRFLLCRSWIGPTGGEAAVIPARTPFLLSPHFDYDVALNSFFLSGDMLCRVWITQDGYARDLRRS